MELDETDRKELMRFETVQTAKPKEGEAAGEIEFDKIKLADVSSHYTMQFPCWSQIIA